MPTIAQPMPSAASQPIKAVLADDHDVVQRNLRLLLERKRDVEVIAEDGDVFMTLRHVNGQRPHVLLLDLPPGTGDVSMTLAQLLPQAKFVLVTTPQPAAQTVAKRAADMAAKFDLELLGAIENMSGFTTPDGERFTIFGEGGGQLLADELDIPLLGKVPLSEALREHADAGTPLVTADPDAPASQAIRQAARGIVAATPQELPVLQAAPAMAEPPPVSGTPLPMA